MVRFLWVVVGCLWLGACTAVVPASPTPTPLPPTTTVLPSVTPSLLLDTDWQVLQAGLAQRTFVVLNDKSQQVEQVTAFRIEPALYDFQVAYHPGEPQTLAEWQKDTGALLVVNGGFFTEAFVATGLTVVEGQPSGVSYGEFAGMFTVVNDSPEVRWLGTRPYNPDEPLSYALQSFPMLVKPGGQMGFPDEDRQKARRMVVGQDVDGRVLFIAAPWGHFTLHELSIWLVASDLNLDVALNLDGGPSAGLYLADPPVEIPAFSRLPTVIIVLPK